MRHSRTRACLTLDPLPSSFACCCESQVLEVSLGPSPFHSKLNAGQLAGTHWSSRVRQWSRRHRRLESPGPPQWLLLLRAAQQRLMSADSVGVVTGESTRASQLDDFLKLTRKTLMLLAIARGTAAAEACKQQRAERVLPHPTRA